LQIHFSCNAFDQPFSGGLGADFCIYSPNKLNTTGMCGGGGGLHSAVWGEFEFFSAILYI
jgi:hypothetical protein